METFTIQNLSFTYPGRKRPALDHVSLEAREGSFAALWKIRLRQEHISPKPKDGFATPR